METKMIMLRSCQPCLSFWMSLRHVLCVDEFRGEARCSHFDVFPCTVGLGESSATMGESGTSQVTERSSSRSKDRTRTRAEDDARKSWTDSRPPIEADVLPQLSITTHICPPPSLRPPRSDVRCNNAERSELTVPISYLLIPTLLFSHAICLSSRHQSHIRVLSHPATRPRGPPRPFNPGSTPQWSWSRSLGPDLPFPLPVPSFAPLQSDRLRLYPPTHYIHSQQVLRRVTSSSTTLHFPDQNTSIHQSRAWFQMPTRRVVLRTACE